MKKYLIILINKQINDKAIKIEFFIKIISAFRPCEIISCASEITFTGENTIVIVLGANESLSRQHVDSAVDVIKGASVLLCQFETPLETTLHALRLHQGHGFLYFIIL